MEQSGGDILMYGRFGDAVEFCNLSYSGVVFDDVVCKMNCPFVDIIKAFQKNHLSSGYQFFCLIPVYERCFSIIQQCFRLQGLVCFGKADDDLGIGIFLTVIVDRACFAVNQLQPF